MAQLWKGSGRTSNLDKKNRLSLHPEVKDNDNARKKWNQGKGHERYVNSSIFVSVIWVMRWSTINKIGRDKLCWNGGGELLWYCCWPCCPVSPLRHVFKANSLFVSFWQDWGQGRVCFFHYCKLVLQGGPAKRLYWLQEPRIPALSTKCRIQIAASRVKHIFASFFAKWAIKICNLKISYHRKISIAQTSYFG